MEIILWVLFQKYYFNTITVWCQIEVFFLKYMVKDSKMLLECSPQFIWGLIGMVTLSFDPLDWLWLPRCLLEALVATCVTSKTLQQQMLPTWYLTLHSNPTVLNMCVKKVFLWNNSVGGILHYLPWQHVLVVTHPKGLTTFIYKK